MAGRDTHLHPPLFSFANLTVCPPPNTPLKLPLCKSINTAAKSVSHMQCPLTIGFTSSNFSLAYFLQRGEGLDSKRGGEEAPASISMFQAILSPSASIQAEGFEEVARKNSSHTLQGEEGQEESQHPDTVQPVGPHASLSLASLPLPFSPSLHLSLSQFIFFFFLFLSFQRKWDSCLSSVPLGSALPALTIQSQQKLTCGGQIPK